MCHILADSLSLPIYALQLALLGKVAVAMSSSPFILVGMFAG